MVKSDALLISIIDDSIAVDPSRVKGEYDSTTVSYLKRANAKVVSPRGKTIIREYIMEQLSNAKLHIEFRLIMRITLDPGDH
jgi:hypothetical protein